MIPHAKKDTELQAACTSLPTQATSRSISSISQTSINPYSPYLSFSMLSPQMQTAPSQTTGQYFSPPTVGNVSSDMEPRSIRSSSSTESFKSAISLQEADLEVARQVKSVQALMHAFRTALQILENIIERRMPNKDGETYIAAKGLQHSLLRRSGEISDKHMTNFKQHGQSYIELFIATNGKSPPGKPLGC